MIATDSHLHTIVSIMLGACDTMINTIENDEQWTALQISTNDLIRNVINDNILIQDLNELLLYFNASNFLDEDELDDDFDEEDYDPSSIGPDDIIKMTTFLISKYNFRQSKNGMN